MCDLENNNKIYNNNLLKNETDQAEKILKQKFQYYS